MRPCQRSECDDRGIAIDTKRESQLFSGTGEFKQELAAFVGRGAGDAQPSAPESDRLAGVAPGEARGRRDLSDDFPVLRLAARRDLQIDHRVADPEDEASLPLLSPS